MNNPPITLCKLVDFPRLSGLFKDVKPLSYRTMQRWKKRRILVVDPLTNLIDIEESKRRIRFRLERKNSRPR